MCVSRDFFNCYLRGRVFETPARAFSRPTHVPRALATGVRRGNREGGGHQESTRVY